MVKIIMIDNSSYVINDDIRSIAERVARDEFSIFLTAYNQGVVINNKNILSIEKIK